MREGMGDKFGVFIQSMAQFIMGFVIAFYYSWKMTLVMLAVMPFVTLAFWALARVRHNVLVLF